MKEPEFEETRLLAMLAAESQYAFQLLFDTYKDHVYRVAIRYTKSPVLAEEIVQDVFMKVWQHRKDLLRVASFESWLYVVSKNRIVSVHRRLTLEWQTNRRFQQKNVSTENNTDHKVREAQYRQLVNQAKSQLSPQQLQVYTMAKEEHLTYEQIGQRLHISSLTVKTHLTRALNSIRSYLGQHGEIIPLLIFCSQLVNLFFTCCTP